MVDNFITNIIFMACSLFSGGRPITVTGKYLDAVLEPKIYFTSGDQRTPKQVEKVRKTNNVHRNAHIQIHCK